MNLNFRRDTRWLYSFVIGVLSLFLLWQAVHSGTVAFQTFFVSHKVRKWEKTTQEEKKKNEEPDKKIEKTGNPNSTDKKNPQPESKYKNCLWKITS